MEDPGQVTDIARYSYRSPSIPMLTRVVWGELSVSVKSEAVEALLLSLGGDPGWRSQDS